MIPFEVDFYVGMLKEWINKQTEAARKMGYKVG
jgi:hypothetical protein